MTRALPSALLAVLALSALPSCGGGGSLGDPVVVDLTAVAGSDGTVHRDGTVVAGGPYLVGDTPANVGQRAFVRFSTAALPADAVVVFAELWIHQSLVTGAPYEGLGDAMFEHVRIDAGTGPGLDGADYGSAAVNEGFALLSRAPALGYKAADVTVAVADDRYVGLTTHDFRLEHWLVTDIDATVDRTTWNDAADALGNGNVPHLVVTYRLP
jgi:hypothetical protein